MTHLTKLWSAWRKYGTARFCQKLLAWLRANVLDRLSIPVLLHPRRYRAAIEEMLTGDYDRVLLWRSSFGYAVPLFQRPQHMAHALARQGCLVLYEVTTATDDCATLRMIAPGLWLFNFNNLLLRFFLEHALEKKPLPRYIDLYSTDWKLSARALARYAARGCGILYEYIDHLSPALAGTAALPRAITEKFDYAMAHRAVTVVVTAERLRQDVLRRRGEENLVLASNGVDLAFLRRFDRYSFEPEFLSILAKGKPIVCYYGALASWFDYDLVRSLAATGRYSVVLIGLKYDMSFDDQLPSPVSDLYYLGPRDYRVLKYYAHEAAVLMIPFLINDITRATSPVKLFEYMALGRPIVTTDMDECRQYRSVLIGHSHAAFISQIEHALTLRNDADYLAALDRDARANDWSSKAAAIIEGLRAREQG